MQTQTDATLKYSYTQNWESKVERPYKKLHVTILYTSQNFFTIRYLGISKSVTWQVDSRSADKEITDFMETKKFSEKILYTFLISRTSVFDC